MGTAGLKGDGRAKKDGRAKRRWPDRRAWPGGGRKKRFLKVVKIWAISINPGYMEMQFLASAWSGDHYEEAGGVWGEPGGGAKIIKMF